MILLLIFFLLLIHLDLFLWIIYFQLLLLFLHIKFLHYYFDGHCRDTPFKKKICFGIYAHRYKYQEQKCTASQHFPPHQVRRFSAYQIKHSQTISRKMRNNSWIHHLVALPYLFPLFFLAWLIEFQEKSFFFIEWSFNTLPGQRMNP